MSRIAVKIAADTSELVKLQTEAKRFASRFRQAFEFTSGAAAFGALAVGFAGIKNGFEQAIKGGVEFNAQLQDSQIGIAAVLRQFDPSQFKTFSAAMEASGDAIDLLKEKAKQSPATFQQLVGAFQGLSGAASSAGLNMKQQVDLVVLMSQTLAGLGIRSEQILQESRALLTGNINEDAAAARILGITKSQIENAKKEGKLYEFLTQKMSGFSEAAGVGAQSYTTALSNMEDVTQQLFAELSKPIFETLRTSILEMNDALGSTDFKAALRPFFQDVATAVKLFAALAKWAIDNAEAISALVRSLTTLGAAYGALRIGEWLVALGREMLAHKANAGAITNEAAAHGTNTAAINLETAAVEANTAARARNAGAGVAGAVMAGALIAPQRPALPPSSSLGPAGAGLLGPALLGGPRGPKTIDIEVEVIRSQRAAQTATRSMTSMFASLGAWSATTAKTAGRLAAANPLAVLAAAIAGWEIGKALRRPIYGHNGAEDLDKADDYQKQWNARAKGFHEQQRAVASVAEKNQYINDLLEARAAIEDQLAHESAPLLRAELDAQLRIIDAMADGAQKINERMMGANKTRIAAEAADKKKTRERDENAAGYDEGRKTFDKTQIEALEKEIGDLSGGRSNEQLTDRYGTLNTIIDAARQAPPVDTTSLDQAESDIIAAKRKLGAEQAKGERVVVAQPSIGSSMPGQMPQISSTPIGDVAGAQAALDAAKQKAQTLRDLHDMELAARAAAVKDNTAEAEAIRKTIEKLKEKQKQLDELTKARRRSEEGVEISERESRGDFAGADKIKRRQGREDLGEQLRAAGHKDGKVDELLARFDAATAASESRPRNVTRADLAAREAEARGDFHGAEKLKRSRDLADYRETLSRQGFDQPAQDELVKRQGALQGAEQGKALRRFNLEQRSLELRGAGKSKEAKAVDRTIKKEELTERFQKDFGLDAKAAAALADRRIGAEAKLEGRGVTVSSLQKIGGGGGFGGGAGDEKTLLREMRDALREIKGNTKPNSGTTWGSDVTGSGGE